MIKIITKNESVYFPIGQIKTMFYDRKTKIVKVYYVDNTEFKCEDVLMVFYNGEEI